MESQPPYIPHVFLRGTSKEGKHPALYLVFPFYGYAECFHAVKLGHLVTVM